MADVVFFEPRKTNVFVTVGGSRKKLANTTNRRVAYKFVFPPDSNFFAKPDQMQGFVSKGGKTDVTLLRKPGKGTTEKMTIQFRAVDEAAKDPLACFADGAPMPEFAGETTVTMVGTE
ncbi:MSP domain protein [Oesophagostomum dentatum]|uniref:MSP domain protein n=1 Tax=Oesophagostomum dentatum TaxID=61180 RepID=A0A0B1SJK5_OESDE|nr:MSP domain protein [Oesophagostomum dentatum]